MVFVKHTGTYQDHSGYGDANRNEVTALYLSGVDVVTDPVKQVKESSNFGWQGELCRQLSNRRTPYKIHIIHLTPDIYKNYKEKGKYTIGRLFWETDKLPLGWVDELNKIDEVWASSPNMVRLFKENGVNVPIYWFPQPIDVTSAEKQFNKYAVAHHDGFLFYAIFQWIERKNPKALLTAYWKEFTGRTDVSLLIKTWRLSYDDREFDKIRDDIRMWKSELNLSHYPRILLIKKVMSQEEIMRLHTTGDCFVQTDRGEGWGRTIQEAISLGKPVLSTSRGGVHEYLKDEHYFKIPSTYVPVTEIPWVKFYTKDQKWAEIDQDILRKSMKYVFNNHAISCARAVLGKAFIKEQFNYRKVGDMMRARLEKIESSL